MAKHVANIDIHIVTYSLVGNLLALMSNVGPMLGQLNVLY